MSELAAIWVLNRPSNKERVEDPMMILLILVLLNLLFIAGFIAYWVIEEKKDEAHGTAPRPRFKHSQPRA